MDIQERKKIERKARNDGMRTSTLVLLIAFSIGIYNNKLAKLEEQRRLFEEQLKNPPIAYCEDINRDGLKDFVMSGIDGTEIWYNKGNNIYKRGHGRETRW